MKNERHIRILELISENDIETQEELAEKLKNEGFKVTQATVSRDIRELGLSKVSAGGGKQKYAVLDTNIVGVMQEKYIRVLREGFVSIDKAMNMLVIHTVSGMAMAVAAALDDMCISEILGCIAGDNTIMAATKSVEDADIAADKIKNALK